MSNVAEKRTPQLANSDAMMNALPNPVAKAKYFLDGWNLAGVGVIQSGTPFDITNNQSALDIDGDMGNAGAGGRADYLGGDIYTSGETKQRLGGWINRNAFVRAPRTRRSRCRRCG